MSDQRKYDDEIAAMFALATSLTDLVAEPLFVFPPPEVSDLPGVSIVTLQQEGDVNADAREHCG